MPALTTTFADALGMSNDGNTLVQALDYAGADHFVYKISLDNNPVAMPLKGEDLSTWLPISQGSTISATHGSHIGVAAVDANGKVLAFNDSTAVSVPYVHALKVASRALKASVDFSSVSNIVLNGQTVDLVNIRLLGSDYNAKLNKNTVVVELQKDIDAVYNGTNYSGLTFTVTVGTAGSRDGKLMITSNSGEANASVSLIGSPEETGVNLLGLNVTSEEFSAN